MDCAPGAPTGSAVGEWALLPIMKAVQVNSKIRVSAAVLAVAVASAFAGSPTTAVAGPVSDPFYTYTGTAPLESIPLGTVLNSRTVLYHAEGIATPVTAQQYLYRTNNARMDAVANATTVIQSPAGNGNAISYQSAYDSLNPLDAPSHVIAGNVSLGGIIYSGETLLLAPILLAGYDIIVPDTEGPTADLAAGPEYGMTTLDSLRAVLNSPSSGLNSATKVALMGCSGGAFGTDWAAQLAPTYAPDVNAHLVGAAMCDVFANPAHSLEYANGSLFWSGATFSALIGASRAYGYDITPYLNVVGLAAYAAVKDQSIAVSIPLLAGTRHQTLFKWQYADLKNVPFYADLANKINAGLAGAPTIPVFISQGTIGATMGTFSSEPGDGVTIAGDTRTLARQFCASGTAVQYSEFPLDHVGTAAPWLLGGLPWIYDRFAENPAPNNCAQIAPGDPLVPVTAN